MSIEQQQPAEAGVTGPAALRRAIALCGGQSALASAIGLTQSHVWNWLNRRSIPAEHCPAIERATKKQVTCEQLRPDVDWAYLRTVCEELVSEINPAAAWPFPDAPVESEGGAQ